MGSATDRALRLLSNQYSRSTHLIEWYKSFTNRAEEIDSLLADLATLRWLSTATGIWLDYLGEIIGLARFFVEEDPEDVFTFKGVYTDPGSPSQGFGSASTPGVGGKFQSLKGIFSSARINDEAYRLWLEVKVSITNAVGTHDDVYRFILEAFGVTSVVVTSNPAGIVLVTLDAPLTAAERAQLIEYAPRVSGVVVGITN